MQERITGFKAYNDNKELLGVVDVTPPAIEAMTDTITGAGVAGEIDSPTAGLTGSMTLSVTWRTVEKQAEALNAPKLHELDVRGSIQKFDKGSGKYVHIPLRYFIKGTPKSIDGGKLETSASMDISQEWELIYFKKELGGHAQIEVDKFNYIYKINGIDYLAEVRKNLGME